MKKTPSGKPRAESAPQPAAPQSPSLSFPGRAVITCREAAQSLSITEQSVMNLIESGQLGAINVGTKGKSFWRIPVTEFEKLLRKRNSLINPP
jgi:excisionase family DNA binding protein